MAQTFEVDLTFLMEREDEGCFLEWRQIDVHQDLQIGPEQSQVMLIVGLQIPEFDLSWLVTMDRDESGIEGVNLAELFDGRRGSRFLHSDGFGENCETRLRLAGLRYRYNLSRLAGWQVKSALRA